MESPECVGTTLTTVESVQIRDAIDANRGLYRRRSSTAAAESEVNGTEEEEDRDEIKRGGRGRFKSPSEHSKSGGVPEDENVNGERNDREFANGGARRGAADDNVTFEFAYRPSSPAHRRIKESPLSSDAIFKQSHAGLFNLCIVVLVAVNSRLIIENLMKYGLLISAGFWFSSKSLMDWPVLMCCLSLPVFPIAAFLVEKLVQMKRITDAVAVTLHIIITTTAILYPVLVILGCDSAFPSGVTLMLFACIVWLKLVSYAHSNYDMRALAKSLDKGDTSSIAYAYEVSFKSLVYFMVAPTLCYQLSYPRSAYIRKGWVVRQLIKLIIFTGFMGFIIEQYINPIVKNSQHPLKGNFLYAIERWYTHYLTIPCKIYHMLKVWGRAKPLRLNILAELLRFGDREFYKDWWNAKTIDEYWRMWNMPVHKWMVRHLYFPCLRNGIPKGIAILIAFLASAIFHELCIAVPCQRLKFWAFIGIMFQVPLVILTNALQNKFRSSMVGNILFWCFFSVFGQPMCVLLYYHDLINTEGSTT